MVLSATPTSKPATKSAAETAASKGGCVAYPRNPRQELQATASYPSALRHPGLAAGLWVGSAGLAVAHAGTSERRPVHWAGERMFPQPRHITCGRLAAPFGHCLIMPHIELRSAAR